MDYIGVTERGDAGLDFSWIHKLQRANIIISKEINTPLIQALVMHKDKCIFHISCTGYGGSVLEKNVPSKEQVHSNLLNLINQGFPVNQIVLRIDPVIPTDKGIERFIGVAELFKDTGISRLRFSFLDMYEHVKTRFNANNISLPYKTFQASVDMRKNALDVISVYSKHYKLESCAEDTNYRVGCISEADLRILGITLDSVNGDNLQRSGCLCLANKKELLSKRKRCKHVCLYCYWSD